ncbi:hypothetical protein EMO92_10340 [Bifidobacterium reuteri]|uniref:Carboxypeptidase regulatory-like domain-containing protein n=1 Tax=Bifidobacterium reuteri TaxID=983706 RepID=A0A5J5E1Z3_9BIFI|nr:carboxypeptidase-like regulatory domain-containing protein [Bifidobacterium reuteri]KAA8823208.1 hypothetical protein EMO92_10340 [Bifidobacterium reuteri]
MSTASKFSGKSSWFSKLSAVVVSSAMAMTMGIAATPAANAYEAKLTTVGEKVEYSTQKRVPAVESSIGVGSLAADGTVALPGTAGYDSALVRVSLFAPVQDTTISVAGSTALFAAAGQDASATVLAPVADGKAQISASANANVRVEVLATFKNDAKTPGATNSVAQPVARGAAALGTEQSVGITGLGGVPATDVRAAYVTADVTLSQAGTVTLGGQTLDLPQGHTVVSTIVVPDAQQGDIKVSSTADGSIALAVRGWVAGSAENAEQVNVEGSYVPTSGADWSTSSASQSKAGAVDVPGATDRALSLALVSATKSANTARTFVDVGENIAGRSEGVLVDAAKGAAPQLEIVESTTAQAKVSVRGDAVNASVLPLGDVLGTPAADKGSVDVAITAPNDGASINLAETGGITLKGTVKSSAAVDHVEVYGNDTKIGNASVQYTADGPTWSMQVASPESQKVTYKAVVVARDDAKGDARITTQVTLPSADDTVISPDAVVVDPNDPANPVTGLTSDTVTFANEPSFGINKVIVSGVGNAAPQGFIRRVVAIDHTDAGWVVTTKPATLTEVFEQANIDQQPKAVDSETTVQAPETTSNGNAEFVGDSSKVITISRGSDNSQSDSQSVQPQLRSVLPQTDSIQSDHPQTREGDDNFVAKIECEVILSTDSDTEEYDADEKTNKVCSEDGDDASKGVSLAFEAALSKLGVDFKLDIETHWDWFLPKPELKYFKVAATGNVDSSVAVKAFGKVDAELDPPIEIGKLVNTVKTIMVGPVPVIIKIDVPINIVADASIEASLKLSWNWNKYFEVGKEYKNNDWHDVKVFKDSKKPEENAPCQVASMVDGEFKFEPQAGLQLAPLVSIYDIVGPEITLDVTAGVITGKVSWNAAQGGKIEGTIGIKFTGEGKLEATVPVIDYKLADVKIAHFEAPLVEGPHFSMSIPGFCNPDGDGGEGDTKQFKLSGMITDGQTGEPIAGALVQISPAEGSGDVVFVSSDGDGKFSKKLDNGKYHLKVELNGYITFEKDVDLSSADQQVVIALAKPTSSTTEWRAVLTWGEKPRDEDSHLIGNTPTGAYHVYYASKEAYDAADKRVAWLDVDDTTSYGPETLTFDVSDSGTYSYYVHNYSAEAPLNTSGAEVRLYRGDQLVKTYNIPANWGDQNIWQVFSIQNGQVVDYVEQPAAASAMSRAAVEPKKQ